MAYKIAFLHISFPAGGAERVSADIAAYVALRGYTSYMFVQRLDRERLLAGDTATLTFLTLPDARFDSQPNAEFIAAELNRLGVDIFILPVNYVEMLFYIREHTRCKIIFSCHNVPLWECFVDMDRRKRETLARRGGWFRWYLLRWPRYALTHSVERRAERRYRKLYETCDAFTVLCDAYREEMCRMLHLDPMNNRVEVMHNFLNPLPADFAPVQPAERLKRVLYVGRLSYVDKRVERLLAIWKEVAQRFPDWELSLVGDGPDEVRLRRIVERERLPRLFFRGYTTDPERYYRDAAILCLTSTFEGWPLVLAEAQRYGVVPVAYDCAGGVHELLAEDGVNGMLVKPFCKRQFVEKLSRLMADDRLRGEMSCNVARKAEGYDREKACQHWLELFDRLMTDRTASTAAL